MATSSTPCHTCRRRRVKCDGALPSCHKCRQRKHECLGYNRLIVWNRGIASRGKMMNKTYTVDKPRPPESGPVSAPPKPPSSASGNCSGQALTVCRAPKDPHFQGLSGSSQFYLYYFGTELSKTYILYDDPTTNPLRQTVSYTAEYEAFRQVVIANSAMYTFRKFHADKQRSLLPISTTRPDQALLQFPVTDPYRDALIAKQRAIQLLAQAIDKGTLNPDVVFGCVALFSFLDYLNEDQNEVHVHLRALREVLKNPKLTASTRGKALWLCHHSLSTDSILFDALQVALFPSRVSNTPLYIEMMGVHETLEADTHFACPLEIVSAMVKIADLAREGSGSHHPSRRVRDELRFCVGQIEALDVAKWAASSPAAAAATAAAGGGSALSGRLSHLETRMHVAEAYKSAFYLFAVRLLPVDACLPAATSKSQLSHMMYHLSRVPATDEGFKATSWPALIMGIEGEERSTVAWALAHLKKISSILPWVYMRRAVELVERTMRIRFTPDGRLAEPHFVAMSRAIMAEYPVINYGRRSAN